MEHKIPIKMNVADREILREVLKIITERRLETKSSVWSSLLSSLIRAHPAFAKSGKVVQEKKRRSLLMTLRRRFLLNADEAHGEEAADGTSGSDDSEILNLNRVVSDSKPETPSSDYSRFDLGVFKEKPFGEDLTLAVLPESWRSVDATSSTTDTETVTPLEEMVSMSAGKSAACMRLPQTYPQNRPRRAMRPPKKYSPSPFKHRPIIRKRL